MAWQIDPAHSDVQFSVRHMMISKVRGSFAQFSGTVVFDEDNPAASSVNVEIDASSITTGDEKRDGHLKSPDFFDVAQYPTITFVSTSVATTANDHATITGDLTMHGVTKQAVLDVEYAGQAKSPWGTTSAGFSGTTTINRREWGLNWNAPLETGGVLVGEDITITIDLEIVQQAEEAEETVAVA